MQNSVRAQAFLKPEALNRYGLAQGRPPKKMEKVQGSYRRLLDQLLSGSAENGQVAIGEQNAVIRRLMCRKVQRILQLAGGREQIEERQERALIHRLRLSNKNKIGAYLEREDKTGEKVLARRQTRKLKNGLGNSTNHEYDVLQITTMK